MAPAGGIRAPPGICSRIFFYFYHPSFLLLICLSPQHCSGAIDRSSDSSSFFYLCFTTCRDYFTHFEWSQTQGGTKKWYPTGKPPDHLQAELGLSHTWPKLGSNPQQWDDKRFRTLKIRVLNHSATGAALSTTGLPHMTCVDLRLSTSQSTIM